MSDENRTELKDNLENFVLHAKIEIPAGTTGYKLLFSFDPYMQTWTCTTTREFMDDYLIALLTDKGEQ